MRQYSFIIFFTFISAINPIRLDKYGMLRPPPVDPINKLKNVEKLWFTQYLDHFNPTDRRTFQQQYFSSDENAKKGGPVFLYIGGEGAMNIGFMTGGSWLTYAKTYGAYCFLLEHRYYGETKPTRDLSKENIKYLSSEQALADIAYFINGMNKKHNFSEKTKWIVHGGSYAGNLAAWSRLKYPHLIHGAVSSSAPLLAKLEFNEYFEVVTNSLETFGDNCTKAIKTAIKEIKKKMKTPAGRNELYKDLNTCEPLNMKKKEDIASFMIALADRFAVIVQYNGDTSPNITDVCDYMTNKAIGNIFNRFCQLMRLLNGNDCIEFKYINDIKQLKNNSWESAIKDGRLWFYQTCTEFAYFTTSSKPKDLFGDSFGIDFYVKKCSDVFGKQINKSILNQAVDRTNIIYGGLKIEVRRVVFVHGSLDPWHALGITKSLSKDAPVIFINGTSHCKDMDTPNITDLPQLTQARKQISSLIGQWLQEKVGFPFIER